MSDCPFLDFGYALKSQKRAMGTKTFVESCRKMVNMLFLQGVSPKRSGYLLVLHFNTGVCTVPVVTKSDSIQD